MSRKYAVRPDRPHDGPVSIGYLRASTRRQDASPEIQEEQIRRRYAELSARDPLPPLDKFFCDPGISGKHPFRKRPAGNDLLGYIRKGDVLFVSKMDRLGRNVVDIVSTVEYLTKRGVRVVIMDLFGIEGDSNEAMMMLILTIAAGVAAYERKRISERISEWHAHRKEKGIAPVITFLAPALGEKLIVTPDGSHVIGPNETELRVMHQIRALHRAGYTPHEIWLNVRDEPTDHWHANQKWNWSKRIVMQLIEKWRPSNKSMNKGVLKFLRGQNG